MFVYDSSRAKLRYDITYLAACREAAPDYEPLPAESFEQAQFYADIEGHPDDPAVERALGELNFFCKTMKLLGTYPRHPFRD